LLKRQSRLRFWPRMLYFAQHRFTDKAFQGL
jgi:hypothetical protein